MNMEKIKCSISLLTLNSAAHLGRCLESLKEIDDIIILDGNSTDATARIAGSYGVPVYKQYDTDEPNTRIKNFTELRVKADSLARYDWIFLLDSDEYASPELISEIRRVLAVCPDPKTIYLAAKKMVMGDRVIEHSYNGATYVVRLYNTKSGVSWKGSKLVHEKLFIPDDVKAVKLRGAFYSYATALYREAVKKDDYYLSLTRQKMFDPSQPRPANRVILWSFWLNFLRAGNVFYKSLKVYLRHGFRQSLPPRHAWRYVRYHLIICWYRVQQLFK